MNRWICIFVVIFVLSTFMDSLNAQPNRQINLESDLLQESAASSAIERNRRSPCTAASESPIDRQRRSANAPPLPVPVPDVQGKIPIERQRRSANAPPLPVPVPDVQGKIPIERQRRSVNKASIPLRNGPAKLEKLHRNSQIEETPPPVGTVH